MSLSEAIQAIDNLQFSIAEHGNFSDEIKKKIEYKLRLDWNYYSNHMEGNTLTMDETRSVMISAINVQDKPWKDIAEMKGHDGVVKEIFALGKGDLRLNEKRIKDIHTAIVIEDDVQKKAFVGKWKQQNNFVFNYKGEKFEFVHFADVPDRMHALLNKTNALIDQQQKNNAIHPAMIAINFHLEYVTIHPFHDGNGRTARLLMNLLLVSFDFPPIIIKEEDEKTYYRLLASVQSEGGPSDLYGAFMCRLLMRSQQLVLDAINGKEIEDFANLDKRIKMLEVELSETDPELEIKWILSFDVFYKIYHNWLRQLSSEIIITIQKFNKFFINSKHNLSFGNGLGYTQFVDEPAEQLLESISSVIELAKQDMIRSDNFETSINGRFGLFKMGGLESFTCDYSLSVQFETTKYTITTSSFVPDSPEHNRAVILTRMLNQPMTKKEIEQIANDFGTNILNHIEYYTKQRGLRS